MKISFEQGCRPVERERWVNFFRQFRRAVKGFKKIAIGNEVVTLILFL